MKIHLTEKELEDWKSEEVAKGNQVTGPHSRSYPPNYTGQIQSVKTERGWFWSKPKQETK